MLIRSVFMLSIAFVLLIGATIFVGFQQSPSEWATFLHLNDCKLPCWIGIQPGKTTLAEAERLIETGFGDTGRYIVLNESSDTFTITDKSTGYSIGITLKSDEYNMVPESIIESIGLWENVSENSTMRSLTVGDLYSELGSIGMMRLIVQLYIVPAMTLIYGDHRVDVFFDEPTCGEIDPLELIDAIGLYSQPIDNAPDWVSEPLPWQGFYRCNNFEN